MLCDEVLGAKKILTQFRTHEMVATEGEMLSETSMKNTNDISMVSLILYQVLFLGTYYQINTLRNRCILSV